MSVYNGAAHLHESVESMMNQEGVSFEFIIVNDGSTDESGKTLDDYAERDKRIRVIHQENAGLTKALIRGCAEAKGEFIARQDAGDLSSRDRLAKQLSCMKKNSNVVLVSCGTRYVGPEGEHLYDALSNSLEATASLRTVDIKKVRGPSHHGCTLFPRKLYEKVGGYRSEFYFGQDLDLWLRLVEHGEHIVVPEVLYQASIKPESISGLYMEEQVKLTKLMLEAARLRQENQSEYPALVKAKNIMPDRKRAVSRQALAQALYFIGACLRRQGDGRARDYFEKALRAYPFHLRSWFRLFLG
jgi:glycosyltransferase involved in cell wall biosynthesis